MSVVHPFCGTETNFDWEDAIKKEYADGAAKGASGKVMIGRDDKAANFIFRYFRVEPGGHTTLDDYHAHDHGVMLLHGRAILHIEGREYTLNPRDIAYISPWEHHWLEPVGDEPMGFLCVIPNKELLAEVEQLRQLAKE